MSVGSKTDTIRAGEVQPEAYRRFVESVQDYAMFFLDKEGHVATWNVGAKRANGYDADEIIGKHFSILYPPSDVAARKPQHELDVAAREGHFEEEGWRVRKDGTMFWASIVLTAIRDERGDHVIGFAKVTRDLTERKLHDDAISQSEERYRLLIQSVKDYAIYMLDPDGHVVSWNEGAHRLKGYTQDEILGEHVRAFYTIADQTSQHPEHELRRALADGRYEEEGWRVRKDGSMFWANVVITPLLAADGKLRGFAKVTRDLTSRKLVEDETRRRSTQVSALNRELETFAYTVAHDLRAPLRAITHLAEIVLTEGEIDDETRKTLDVMHKSADRMAVLVENLLNLSRSTSGVMKLEPVDLSKFANEICVENARTYKSAATRYVIQPDMIAEADANLLRVALDNLIRNAFKFSARAADPVVEIGSETQGGKTVYFVHDNGIGFETKEVDDLFAPFHRLRSANTFEGSGIGLATVKRIVERHGGRVWARSEPGKGATFFFTLAASAN